MWGNLSKLHNRNRTWSLRLILPVLSSGKYFNSELKIDQSVFTVAPSKTQVQPGMVITFELFLLRGSHAPTDVTVAWGAFPICDTNFDIISGPFKTPMLRGHMDKQIDRYERIEQLISADLDHWMANLYFDVVRLPRYLAGQKEYEVELQFSSGLLNSPDRVKTAENETFDGEAVPTTPDDEDQAAEPIDRQKQEEIFTQNTVRRRRTTKESSLSLLIFRAYLYRGLSINILVIFFGKLANFEPV